MAGAVLSVVVTIDGEEYTDLTAAVAGEDKSAEVSIIDAYGLQSDGTGIVTDRLELTYGASFGTPTAVTWYRDGAVVATAGGNTYQNMNLDGGLFLNVSAARGTGNYKAVVVANNQTYETNEIVISSKEDQAVIESFTVEDDYTDGTDVVYNTTDTRAVATVTLSKNFQGKFSIYKKTNTKFTGLAVDTMVTAANDPALSASDSVALTAAGAGDGASILTANAGSNYDVLNMRNPAGGAAAPQGEGLGYIARDGKVTYKWVISNTGNTTGLTRGEEYVLVFDQKSKADDNIGSGNENKFETAVTAPYVKAPAKAELSKAAKNAAVEITFKDADDNVMTFMGMQTPIVGLTNIAGKTSSDIYSATKTGVELKDATKKSNNNALGQIKAGVWTTSTEVSGTDAFWFANLVFNKGVYGKDEITVRTADKQVAYDAATGVSVSYSKTAPKDIKVSFGNLRADSTVYLVALLDDDGAVAAKTTATVSDETAEAAFKRIYEDKTQAIASADVTAGTGDYTFTGAIQGVTMGDDNGSGHSTAAGTTDINDHKNGNSYIAVVVPEDATNYSPTYSSSANPGDTAGSWTAAGNGVDISPVLTSYKLVGKCEFTTGKSYVAETSSPAAAFANATDTAIVAVDQFGGEMTSNNVEATTAVNMTLDNPTVAYAQTNVMTLQTARSVYDGTDADSAPDYPTYSVITLAKGGATATINKGEAYTLKLSTGQTIKIVATSADGTPVATATWKISIS